MSKNRIYLAMFRSTSTSCSLQVVGVGGVVAAEEQLLLPHATRELAHNRVEHPVHLMNTTNDIIMNITGLSLCVHMMMYVELCDESGEQ